MRSLLSICVLVFLSAFLPIAPTARADLDEAAGEYAKNPGANPPVPGKRAPPGETEIPGEDAERELARRARKSKVKTVYEGLNPGKVTEVGSGSLAKSLVIHTEFDYTGPKRRVRTDRSVFLTEEHRDWVNLTHPRDGVAVLGRLLDRDPKQVKLEYLIIDTSREDEGLINPPVLLAPIGQKLLVNLDGQSTKASLTIEAKWRKQ